MRTLFAVLLIAAAARAEEQSFPCSLIMDPNDAPVSDPRLDHLVVGGVHVNVLLPRTYATSSARRYPVLYLFHGAFGDEDSWTTQTDLIAFTAQLVESQEVIAVMPDGGHLPAATDWADGQHPQETYLLQTLLPFIDATYRTRADRAHRAVAGFSGGGLDSMSLAERHPELFVAAGAFSGFLQPYSDGGIGIVQEFAAFDQQLCGATYDWTALWGDPAVTPLCWIAHDPVSLAASLSSTSVYFSAGNGTPCPGDPDDPTLEGIEMLVNGMAQDFDAALTAAGVAHVANFKSCGIHAFGNSSADLRAFWPLMVRAFDTPAPRAFDFTTAEASASAFDWTFANATPQLSSARGVSRLGLQLSGAGVESVRTAPLFGPGAQVCVAGARTSADGEGRLSFSVDLGAGATVAVPIGTCR